MKSEYFFGSFGDRLFTVTKFEVGSEEPLDSYLVDHSKSSPKCDCPAWTSGKTRPCKHIRMVEQFIKAGEPALDDYRCVGIGKDWMFSLTRKE